MKVCFNPAGLGMRALPAALLLGMSALPASAELVVRIGSPSDLTGPQSMLGVDHAHGVTLAVEELNRRHLVIGGQPVRWLAVEEDDQSDPKQAAAVAQKFIDLKVNAVVGHFTSGTTAAAAPLYERAGIVSITAAATSPKLSQQGWSHFFRVLADDDAIGGALARYAVQQLHAKRVVVVDDRMAYGQGLADVFAARITSLGVRPLAREYTNAKAVDFSALLTRVRPLHPDLVFYGGVYGQAGPMLRQMRQLGVDARYMGGDNLCGNALPALAGSAVEGTLCAEGGLPLASMPQGRAWKQRYDARFGADTYRIFSPYTYDATMVLAAAMVAADSVQPERFLPALRTIDVAGVTNPHIRFAADGNLVDPQVTISEYHQGVKSTL